MVDILFFSIAREQEVRKFEASDAAQVNQWLDSYLASEFSVCGDRGRLVAMERADQDELLVGVSLFGWTITHVVNGEWHVALSGDVVDDEDHCAVFLYPEYTPIPHCEIISERDARDAVEEWVNSGMRLRRVRWNSDAFEV